VTQQPFSEKAFIAVALAQQANGAPAEITAVLNQLPFDPARLSPADVVEHVDALMARLYQRGSLSCPGHRWLSEPIPSIAGHLKHLLVTGSISWEARRGWYYSEVTSYFFVTPGGCLGSVWYMVKLFLAYQRAVRATKTR
jgi:hypothetical protein